MCVFSGGIGERSGAGSESRKGGCEGCGSRSGEGFRSRGQQSCSVERREREARGLLNRPGSSGAECCWWALCDGVLTATTGYH